MSILDDAIREHLELKRQHGADESELKRLEDEAFGPPGRPDENPFAEAPTEFLATEAPASLETGGEEGRRRINIADLQEPPPPEPNPPQAAEAPAVPPETPQAEVAESQQAEISEAPEPPQPDAAPMVPAEDAAQVAPPAEEAPAMEHELPAEPSAPEPSPPEPPTAPAAEAPAEPAPSTGPSTEERHAIADQPTQFFDIEAEIASEEEPPADVASPSDEEIADAEAAQPKLAPAEPPTEIYAARPEAAAEPLAEEPISEEHDYQDDFFSEQRLSDELDQALEAPLTDEHEVPAETDEHEVPAETDEHEVSPSPAAGPAAPVTDEHERLDLEDDLEDEEDDEHEPRTAHEDVLEDTPDFLEDAPEDDDLWFEQRPPKDFDFDD